MKLANNLYTLVALDEMTNSAKIALCSSSVIYKAHFPEHHPWSMYHPNGDRVIGDSSSYKIGAV